MQALAQQDQNDKGEKSPENENLKKSIHLCILPIALFVLNTNETSRGLNQGIKGLLSIMLSFQWYARVRCGQAWDPSWTFNLETADIHCLDSLLATLHYRLKYIPWDIYYRGTSSSISVAPSRPTVMITSPNVLVLKPASQ